MGDFSIPTHRRGFVASLAASAAALGLAELVPGGQLAAATPPISGGIDPELEAWFGKIKGKHRMVFDAPAPNEGMPAIWPRIYLNTMNATYGTTDADDTGVVILRHEAAGLALNDAMWAKYHIGEALHVKDGDKPATRNVFAKIEGLPIPGLGIAELLKGGVLIGVCNIALAVNSAATAKKMNLDPTAVKNDWVANLIPGIQIVPSGVMAVGRAQEQGCNYCFAG